MTLTVNQTLEISQVGRPSMVNKQNKQVSNTETGHKSLNLVIAGVFSSADRASRYSILAVLMNFQKSAVCL